MNRKEFLPLTIILLMFLIGIYLYPNLPEKVPIHWNAEGKINGYGSKLLGLFLMPMITLIVYIIFMVIPKIEVYKKNIAAFSEQFFLFKLIFVLFFLVLYIITIIQSMGFIFNMNYVVIPACAVFFYIIGYLLKYAKRNFFIGIRTPWTLSSEKVWNKTHTLGSKLFRILAFVTLTGILFGKYGVWVMIISLLACALFLVVYSYILFEKEVKKSNKING